MPVQQPQGQIVVGELIGRAAQPVAGVVAQVNGRAEPQDYGKEQDEEQPAKMIARRMGVCLVHVAMVGRICRRQNGRNNCFV